MSRGLARDLRGARFPDLGGFGYVHHRFLNDLSKLELLLGGAAGHRASDVAEGDVCWYQEPGKVVPFLWHPGITHNLSRRALRRKLLSGELMLLEEVLDQRFSDIPFVVELKVGLGPEPRGIEKVLELLELGHRGNYWIDSFSPRHLRIVKDVDPTIPTSLHTSTVLGRALVKTAFEHPPLGLRRLEALWCADAVTVTWRHGARLMASMGLAPARTHRRVLEAGMRLIFGSVGTPKALAAVRDAGAMAAYVTFRTRHLEAGLRRR